ncbi:hypothetical protein TREES_T100000216 [Tupaia chinensis]|uniref:Uncharacterized protein n=1 Tax=Tupaia chinensis TaxID=246437 RepID=L9L9I6_TUPCH|nr:hypothetical protein TREES_T100000216 [Tupaia chinensis]
MGAAVSPIHPPVNLTQPGPSSTLELAVVCYKDSERLVKKIYVHGLSLRPVYAYQEKYLGLRLSLWLQCSRLCHWDLWGQRKSERVQMRGIPHDSKYVIAFVFKIFAARILPWMSVLAFTSKPPGNFEKKMNCVSNAYHAPGLIDIREEQEACLSVTEQAFGEPPLCARNNAGPEAQP